ncbi:glycoside hydrolase family 2 TIM barrel-domain containing protein [Flammeovirga pacifica]|uniref:Beta-galactosidase n=1 Tax=Flammeovirga pacifica TaxID=915059 RepID=A0A1S1YUW7_FLAPC|nr:glycoside hydrolase family 2 TIM barrel-domain containing protein [Flammeovirga pacifica]OHX64810.1 hypothetical protein NH26_23210 [Flammeovirga pacifica]
MKLFYIFILQILFCSLSLQAVATPNVNYTINNSWQFMRSNEIKTLADISSNSKNAEWVNIPHTWNDKDVIDEEEGYYRGMGWYIKEVSIPTSFKEKEVFLQFEGVNTLAEVYINGQLSGTHVGGYTRFVVPVSKFITFDDQQLTTTFKIVVKVDNSFNKNRPSLTADFTFFGGIYRDINLITKDKVHFNFEQDGSNGCFLTTPKVSVEKGELHLKAHIKNDASSKKKIKLISKIFDPKGKLIAEKISKINLVPQQNSTIDIDLDAVDQPQLWDTKTPHLYQVVCELWDAKTNTKVDEVVNPLGFRWFEFDVEKGFFLNGQSLKLIGTNRHQDYKGIGNALPDYLHVEDIRIMKEMGSNFLRIAHYPQDPYILEACDRLGILATVETPVINTVTENEQFDKNCLSAQLEMIRQSYNHPSLIIWAYMNEILLKPKYKKDPVRYKKYTDYIVQLANKLETLTREEDPFRYTMIPNHGGMETYRDAGLTEVPMIVGWNIYDGWYGREYDALEAKLIKFHEGVNKPFIITEYGAGADPRLHTLNPTRFDFTQEYATNYHQHYVKVIHKLPFVAGANVWNYADFSSEHRVDAVQSVNNKGLVGIDRKPKDVYYFYQAALLEKPFVGIAAKTWKRRTCIENQEGKSVMPVQVFSNQEQVELFINGKSCGKKKVEEKIAVFEVPFIHGINRLKAVTSTLEDYAEVRINILPQKLDTFPANGFSINLGDERFFYDDQIDQAWGIGKKYTEGSWGTIGGTPYVRPSKRKQHPYGTNHTIQGTYNDPVYQTQLVGIEKFRMDVPPGVYDVQLHFAELEGSSAKHLPYDLMEGEQVDKEQISRTFSVKINDQLILNRLDILTQFGEYKAIKYKAQIRVEEGQPLLIEFDKIIGEPVMNAIEIYKKI